MRIILLAIGLVTGGVLVLLVLPDSHVQPPPVGPSVEKVCVEAMRQSGPDLSWVVPDREEEIRGREIESVTFGELPLYREGLLRIAGVLHVEFEWVALYPSRAAMETMRLDAPWVELSRLWPYQPFWRTHGPSITDRCVVVEGTYRGGAAGHFGEFKGEIDVLRLDVWSTPYRPFVLYVPPPPPPPPPPRRQAPAPRQPSR